MQTPLAMRGELNDLPHYSKFSKTREATKFPKGNGIENWEHSEKKGSTFWARYLN